MLKYFFISIVLLFTILLIGCSTKKLLRPTTKWKLELEQQATTFFEGINDISKISYYYDEIGNKEYLISYCDKDKKYTIFDFQTGGEINNFSLEFEIHTMYVHTIDSIFVFFNSAFGNRGNIIGLLNSKGEIVARYNLTSLMVIDELDDKGNKVKGKKLKMEIADNPYSFFNFCYFDSTLYLNVSPTTTLQNKFHYPTIASAPLTTANDKAFSFHFYYPEFYKQDTFYQADYLDFVVRREQSGIINVIISYILSDSIEINRFVPRFEANDILIFDTPEYDTVIFKNISSKYKGEIFPAIQNSQSIINTYFGFKYAYFKYDKFRNIYYRIAIHTIGKKNFETEHNNALRRKWKEITGKHQNWSMIIADSKFNLMEEKLFLAEQNYSPNILITKEGIAFINIQNTQEAEGINIVKNKINIKK